MDFFDILLEGYFDIDNHYSLITIHKSPMIAVILAGGTGSRMGSDKPKQLLLLDDGRSILEHTIDVFNQSAEIEEICIVMHADWIDEASQLVKKNGWPKVNHIIAGGSERYLSTLAAIEQYLDRDDNFVMLLHDAARPFVSQKIISDVATACKEHEAVAVGIPSTDTIWQVNPFNSTIQRIPERPLMWRAQTPQAFRFNLIRDAYQRALQDPQFRATDDCGVVARYMPEVHIHIVKGSEENKKITFINDL